MTEWTKDRLRALIAELDEGTSRPFSIWGRNTVDLTLPPKEPSHG